MNGFYAILAIGWFEQRQRGLSFHSIRYALANDDDRGLFCGQTAPFFSLFDQAGYANMAFLFLLHHCLQLHLFHCDLFGVLFIHLAMEVKVFFELVEAIFEVCLVIVPFIDIVLYVSFHFLLELPLLSLKSFFVAI